MEFMDCFNGISGNSGFHGIIGNGNNPTPASLILDSERGELVRALLRPGQKGVTAEKALNALRNHSEAERRRRERINGHLSTLRGLIPGTTKMDKAALLAEVISHLREMRKTASEAAKGMLVPTDTDEVIVEQHTDTDTSSGEANSITIRAFLCCDYKHELINDLKQALENLPLMKTLRAEIATLEDRMVNVFVITASSSNCCSSDEGKIVDNHEECQLIVSSIRQALMSVLDKFYASEDFSSRNALASKRRRVSFYSSPTSSSLGSFW